MNEIDWIICPICRRLSHNKMHIEKIPICKTDRVKECKAGSSGFWLFKLKQILLFQQNKDNVLQIVV